MKTLSHFALAVFLAFSVSCTNEMIPEKEDFSITEAMEAFKSEYGLALASTKSIDAMNYSLAGGDYTPQWEDAEFSENSYIWSLEIPVLSNYGIVSKNRTTGEIKSLERRLVFIKSKVTADVFAYMLILSEKTRTKSSGIPYVHAGNKDNFTGLATYTTLSGKFIQINKYNNGILGNSISTEKISSEDSGHKLMHEILEDEEFGIILYGGGGGPTFEGICELCGYNPCMCEYFECRWCRATPCECHICSICGKIECTCNNVCPNCHRSPEQCVCDPKESYCSDCGSTHTPGASNCKARCPFCSKLFINCNCK